MEARADMAHDVFRGMEALEVGPILEAEEMKRFFEELDASNEQTDRLRNEEIGEKDHPADQNLPDHLGDEQEADDGEDVMEMLDFRQTEAEEREEGELDEDLAKCIHDNARSNGHNKANVHVESEQDNKANGHVESEQDDSSSDSDEDEDNGETMMDSDPICPSESELSSEEEDWSLPVRQNRPFNEIMEGRKQKGESSDEDDDGKPPRTKNEVSTLPPVPKVEVELQPHHVLVPLGRIVSVVESRVIVEGNDDHQALDEGSILWLAECRSSLGFVDEVFGPIKKPRYAARFNDPSEIPSEARVSSKVAFVPDFAKTVFKNPDLYKKGYDASGLHDEELSDDEVEFSDDEKEAEYKRERARAKRASGETKKDSASGTSHKIRRHSQQQNPAEVENAEIQLNNANRNRRYRRQHENANGNLEQRYNSNRNQGYQNTARGSSEQFYNGNGSNVQHDGVNHQQHGPPGFWPAGQAYVMPSMGMPYQVAFPPGFEHPMQVQGMQYSTGQFYGQVPTYVPGMAPINAWWPAGAVVGQPTPQQLPMQGSGMRTTDSEPPFSSNMK